ncbi:unnamed protein product, partial [marine sediment metagenome]
RARDFWGRVKVKAGARNVKVIIKPRSELEKKKFLEWLKEKF